MLITFLIGCVSTHCKSSTNCTMISTNWALLAAQATREEETPAQAEAQANAGRKLKMERFARLWNQMKEIFYSNM